MEDLKKEYDEIKEQSEKIIEEMKSLEENDVVKKYFELKKQSEKLYEKQHKLYKKMKKKEYNRCRHILVYSKIERDSYEDRTYRSRGCIKCGLDDSVLEQNREWLPFSKKVMYDYLTELMEEYFRDFKGRETKIACDLDLAQEIYSKIKESHPDIDDDMAIKYFKVALNDIRNIEVSEKRKTNRAKRLSLDHEFNRWNSGAVHHD